MGVTLLVRFRRLQCVHWTRSGLAIERGVGEMCVDPDTDSEAAPNGVAGQYVIPTNALTISVPRWIRDLPLPVGRFVFLVYSVSLSWNYYGWLGAGMTGGWGKGGISVPDYKKI